ncbi:sulfatase [Halomarina oriensis]|uniref:Sulfatase-like hydrolase/transferase n=1 Tax=Halomarina oriensis TaxID=671145 RepID=A0A6B0GP37_9EURY|nr:sulfatase [Halomarina oriensis]MWG34433.1 sulfatase-like hydrolase/transferase [Halomarina oriensis]
MTPIRNPNNVLVLTVDCLRADISQTMQWDSFLEPFDTIEFTDCIATGSGTSTSFPGILTSTYPLEFDGYGSVGSDRTTLAGLFSSNGFATGGFHSNPLIGEDFGYGDGFDEFYDSVGGKRRLNSVLRRALPKPLHEFIKKAYFKSTDYNDLPYERANEVNIRAEQWIRSADSPWFCWIHYMEPHHPYKPPADYTDVDEAVQNDLWMRMNEDPESITDEEVDVLRSLYEAEIEYLSTQLTNLVDSLSEDGLLDDTLIVVLADHGEEFRDHGGLAHRPVLYEELVHVPLLFSGDVVEADRTDERLVSTLDVATTVAHASGISPADSYRGADLLSVDEQPRERCFSELSHTSGGGGEVVEDQLKVSCRTVEWSFIHDRQQGDDFLFNRQTDFREQNDVSSDHPAVVEEFRDEVLAHLDVVLSGASNRREEVGEEVEDRLRELGYR